MVYINTEIMENFTNRLYLSLENELEQIKDREENSLIRLKLAISKTRKALRILRSFIIRYTFNTVQEEIKFFKSIKTLFFSLHIFHVYRYTIETGTPANQDELLRDYYINELNFLQKFFDQHTYEHQYYLLQATELDEHYFTRQKSSTILPADEQVPDPLFSTSHDYLFSRIRAFKLLQDHLCYAISKLDRKPKSLADQIPDQKTMLRWTGDKVNLVEVIYGLFYTGQLNDGNAGIADIIRWMESNLNIDLGKAYRKFVDIRRRKTLSHTRFLDQMRDSIDKRIEEDTAWKPDLKKPDFR